MSSVSLHRGPARGVILLAVGALVAGALTAGTIGATPAVAHSANTHTSASHPSEHAASAARRVHYAVDKPLCATPANSATYTCDALRRVTVPKGTPGAHAYVEPSIARGPSGGLTPADLAKAYGYNPKVNRRYQTVALVDWYNDPHALADLNRFDAHYGIHRETARSFRVVNQAGKRSPLPKSSRSSSGEISLDIEAVRAVCQTCRILLVEADGPTENNLAAAENTAARMGATEISNSFGIEEHKVSSTVRKAFDHPGIVITASTGDSGWYGWDAINDGRSTSPGRASYPSTDPRVIAVGGTTLNLTSSGTRASETVWNGNGVDDARGIRYSRPLGASGGGCSRYFTAPVWQSDKAGYADAYCHGKRLATDVAADADPQTGLDVINTYHPDGMSNWATIGGTSLSSPLIAAMFALAGGAHGVKYPAQTLYRNDVNRPYSRYDVTSGGNSFCGGDTPSQCSAALADVTQPSTRNPNGLGAGVTDCSYPYSGKHLSSVPAKRHLQCNAMAGFDGPSGIGTPRSMGLFDPYLP